MTGQFNTEKKQNAWITFLKAYSLEHSIPYASAISDPKCKEAYNNSKGTPTEPLVNKPKVKKNPKIKKEKNVVEPEVVKTEVVEPEGIEKKQKNKKKKKKKNKNNEVVEVAE
jgi:hypothetical protein